MGNGEGLCMVIIVVVSVKDTLMVVVIILVGVFVVIPNLLLLSLLLFVLSVAFRSLLNLCWLLFGFAKCIFRISVSINYINST